ncbi:MAG: hypothetical protein ND866_15130 [Pyrinomonadaceae bacterium]|nr:hypothetical protein [Pyrinomonadaceae bacterium]
MKKDCLFHLSSSARALNLYRNSVWNYKVQSHLTSKRASCTSRSVILHTAEAVKIMSDASDFLGGGSRWLLPKCLDTSNLDATGWPRGGSRFWLTVETQSSSTERETPPRKAGGISIDIDNAFSSCKHETPTGQAGGISFSSQLSAVII